MRTIGAILMVLAFAACGPAPITAPSPSSTEPSLSPRTASVAPTATPPTATGPASRAPATTTPIPFPTTAQLAAAGGGVLWVLVAETHLFRSTDRGDTWQERQLPQPSVFPAPRIAFVSDRDGWMLVADPPGSQCQAQTVRLYRTSDGAATWQLLDARGVADRQCKDTLAFTDANHGYITAGDVNGPPIIYRTSDGGLTWTASTPLPDPPGFTTVGAGVTLRAGPVANFGPSLFVDGTGYGGGREVNYIFQSSDGGAKWSYNATAPQDGVPAVFVTPSRWIQLVFGDLSRETTDGGRTWHTLATDYSQAAPYGPQVVFGDGARGYATTRGGIQRTSDGGLHWAYIKTPGTQ